jgi:hypothetical protein
MRRKSGNVNIDLRKFSGLYFPASNGNFSQWMERGLVYSKVVKKAEGKKQKAEGPALRGVKAERVNQKAESEKSLEFRV